MQTEQETMGLEAVHRARGKPGQPARAEERARLRELRIEVAVLRERVAAEERLLAERGHRIRDLRGSLQIVAAGLMNRDRERERTWATGDERRDRPDPRAP